MLTKTVFDLKIEHCEFIDPVIPKKKLDYDEATEDYINYWKRVRGVCSIYKFGYPSVPGFSDLDFVVVLKDDYRHRYAVRYDIEFFTENTRYILLHPQSFISRTTMRNIHYFYYIPYLRKVWGEEIEVEQPEADSLRALKFFMWANYFVNVAPNFYIKMLVDKKIRLRGSIAKLKALKYLASLLRDQNGSHQKYQWFYDCVEQLREEWFNCDDRANKEKLLNLLSHSVEVCCYLISRMNDCLETESIFRFLRNAVPDDVCGMIRKNNTTYFKEEYDPCEFFNRTIKDYKATGQYTQILPINLYRLLLHYLSVGGELAQHTRSQIIGNPHTPIIDEQSLFFKRAQLLNQHLNFLDRNKITDGLSFNPGYQFLSKQLRGECRIGRYEYLFKRKLFFIEESLKKFSDKHLNSN